MPHFILDCSENIPKIQTPENILRSVHDVAHETGLFAPGDIKVRLNPFPPNLYTIGGTKNDFIHVFGNVMEGRTPQQKSDLARRIVGELKRLFPEVPIISINIRDFEKATYCNRNMIE